ncbi:transposase [Rhizobium mongolense]|uniref:transposase n=2 Tax=Rhizobium mongolense TaxID=57676 RepID=UPI000A073D3D|nr:transposase [Rhizobium mongolense]
MSATVSDHRTFHIIEAAAGLLEGPPRQMWRHRSSDFKAQAVAETVQPGASVSVVARGLGVDPSQLFTWPSGRTTDYSGARPSASPVRCYASQTPLRCLRSG